MLGRLLIPLTTVTTCTRQRRLNELLTSVRRHMLQVLRLVNGAELSLLALRTRRLATRLHLVLLVLIINKHLVLGVLFDEQHLVRRGALSCASVRLPELLLRLLLLLHLLDRGAALTVLLLDEHGLTECLLVRSRTCAGRGSQLLLRVLGLGELLE